MLDFLGAVLYIVLGIAAMALVFILGAIAAASAAAAGIVAVPLSLLISLIWGVAFVDALAWTWSLLSMVAFLVGITAFSQR